MPAEALIPLEAAAPPASVAPSVPPVAPPALALLSDNTGARSDGSSPERLAYLFRLCPTHPLRQILSDYRGVHE
ncbi:MAG: hypothetical protein EKK45_20410 [Curvibacter sp.]|nr:MAG: hypothetical protein EKK45_20410 [Curvibacter sp.]